MNKLSEIFSMPLFPIISGLLVYIFIKINSSKAGSTKKKDELLARERQSNFAKRVEIPEELFLNIREDLPFKEIVLNENIEKSVKRLEKEILSCKEKKIIKPAVDTKNIELKETYGVEVFKELTVYEQNYNRCITYINNIAKVLIEDGQKEMAEEFLKEAINLKSDVSNTYIYLIDIYKKDKEKLSKFISDIKDNSELDSYCSKKVLEYYNELKSN